MQAKLDAQGSSWAQEIYRNPSGAYISGTLGAHAEKVQAGTQSPDRRDTCSYIYHVRSGTGESEIVTAAASTECKEAKPMVVRWGPHDTFAVPAWSRVTHRADEGSDAYLFVLSDRPLIEKLNMYAEGGA